MLAVSMAPSAVKGVTAMTKTPLVSAEIVLIGGGSFGSEVCNELCAAKYLVSVIDN